MEKTPKWLQKRLHDPTTRARSKKQEQKIANDLGGRVTVNSGATFEENDVRTDKYDIEAKTTSKNSYSIKIKELAQLVERTESGKIPLFVIQFENINKSYVVMDYDDFLEQEELNNS